MRIKTPLIIAATAAALVVAPVATSSFTGADLVFAKGKDGDNGGGNGGGKGGGNGGGNSGKSSGSDGGNGKSKGTSFSPKDKSSKSTGTSFSGSSKSSNGKKNATKTNHGAIASELKGLNAAHASPNALANASPNSQVGRIATYKAAVEAGMLADKKLDDANVELAALDEKLAGYSTERTVEEIDGDLAGLTEPTPTDLVEGDEGYEEAVAQYDADMAAYNEAKGALDAERAEAEARDADLAAKAALEAEIATLEEEAAAADAAEHDALLAASNGRELSPEALEELNRMLDPQMPVEEEATSEEDTTEEGAPEEVVAEVTEEAAE
ncbi:hypothetical protein [Sedimentimonas flavescens]|uniref:hypothetical protein n=1 Tax=Sedimentimonas flavescens TaxID=2851012 RepID=UPI0021A66189|nr:hypothetical protein [Sedimentimonas flavescens]MCT2541028.1 hypothetical protein [Sedimentimonas flavescens]